MEQLKNKEVGSKTPGPLDKLSRSVDNLVYTVANFSDNKPWKAFRIAILKGIAFGFGSILGATVVVAIFVYILGKIKFVPLIGDFVQNLLEYMKAAGIGKTITG
ncbi:hypothetical protein HZA39_00030 [Candidatus Peregrinibacteria bacterium]|nr:hypothetical protein [Candidatus Peregrinibacteria bacterium]